MMFDMHITADVHMQEISKIVGEMWQRASQEEKAPYIEQVPLALRREGTLLFLCSCSCCLLALQPHSTSCSPASQARIDKLRYQEALSQYQQRLAAEHGYEEEGVGPSAVAGEGSSLGHGILRRCV
jgi:hypothetical protein